MHILLRFLWDKQWHGVHVFHFLGILNFFDKCEHYINTLLKFSLKIQVWNILQCCIITLKELEKHKVQCEILA
jgi:hypothetical protein